MLKYILTQLELENKVKKTLLIIAAVLFVLALSSCEEPVTNKPFASNWLSDPYDLNGDQVFDRYIFNTDNSFEFERLEMGVQMPRISYDGTYTLDGSTINMTGTYTEGINVQLNYPKSVTYLISGNTITITEGDTQIVYFWQPEDSYP